MLQPDGNAFIRADNRESLRDIVLLCATPLPAARCISGCAARNASPAACLSPPAMAASTFLTKVLMRDFRAWLRSVRRFVCRMRLRAEAVLAIDAALFTKRGCHRRLDTGGGEADFYARGAFRSSHAQGTLGDAVFRCGTA